MSDDKNFVILYTGNGKGKTTAALGLVTRFIGHQLKVCICQFIKSDKNTGEFQFFSNISHNAEIYLFGEGFIFDKTSDEKMEKHIKSARYGFEFLKSKASSGTYSLIIADELLDAIAFGFITLNDVLGLIKNLHPSTSVVLTGREAPAELIEAADTVTEMKEVKHHYQKGVKAQKGIEY